MTTTARVRRGVPTDGQFDNRKTPEATVNLQTPARRAAHEYNDRGENIDLEVAETETLGPRSLADEDALAEARNEAAEMWAQHQYDQATAPASFTSIQPAPSHDDPEEPPVVVHQHPRFQRHRNTSPPAA